jgi:hypothetical protein
MKTLIKNSANPRLREADEVMFELSKSINDAIEI